MTFKQLELDYMAGADLGRLATVQRDGTEQATAPRASVAVGDAPDPAIIRVTPTRIISFGIDDTDTEPHVLKVDIRDV
jgi:pyridoxamine 5'-phosphate oxidase family protein